MTVEEALALTDEILEPWRSTIGGDFDGYRNHCRRMLAFCFILGPLSADDAKKCAIAAAFHDIGIWTEDTFDYIPPSVSQAATYLEAQGLASWTEEVALLISEHHKVRPYRDPRHPLVEIFRKADLVDFSLGLGRFAIPRSEVKRVRDAYPNLRFHRFIVRRASSWFIRHPFNPAPMLKW